MIPHENITFTETSSHLRVETLDINLLKDLRKIKYNVPHDGLVIWDSKNGYDSRVNSSTILNEYISNFGITKVKLYDIVLPQKLFISDYKLAFYVEKEIIDDWNGIYNFRIADIRREKRGSTERKPDDYIIYEGTFVVCY